MILPLGPFINSANRAETLGPVLDPTLYKEGGQKLAKIKRLAEILLDAKTKILEVHSEIRKELETADAQAKEAPNPGTPINGP